MSRPTKDAVDDALALIDELVERSPVAVVLAAEVRALREQLSAAVFEAAHRQLTLERVAALSLKWMDYVVLQTGEGIPDCAADLERALEGE